MRQFLDRHGAGHGNTEHIAVHLADGGEIFVRVVTYIAHDHRRDHHHCRIRQHQHGRIGWCGLHILRGHAPACAHLVFDNHGAAEQRTQLVRDDACHPIATAARWVTHNDAEQLLRLHAATGEQARSRQRRTGGQGAGDELTALNGHGALLISLVNGRRTSTEFCSWCETLNV